MDWIFFDLDGTLTDPALGITNSVLYALRHYGYENVAREELYSFIGPPLVDSFREHFGFSTEQSHQAITLFQEYFSSRGLYENRVYDGIPEMLRHLRESGKHLALATSKPEPFARRVLEHFSLFPYFDAVFGAEMEEKNRFRKTDILRYALEGSGADPSRSVMVGDRSFDMEGGRNLGMKTLGVLYGYGSREELTGAGADRICGTVSECEEVLLQWEK